jgi:hypothetical protein
MRRMSFPDTPTSYTNTPAAPLGHPSTWPAPSPVAAPPAKRRAVPVVVASLVVLALVGAAVYVLGRDPKAAPPPSVAASSASFTASGALVLKRGEFSWNSAADPTCQGLNGYSDLRAGTQVTVTDASGKKLAIGVLAKGNAGDFSTEADGTQRAASCSLPFAVSGVPRGVGPYGIEISHRGVQNYNEAQLDSGVILGFS